MILLAVRNSTIWRGILLVLAAMITGCAGMGVPRDTGLYSVEGGDVQRLDGHREWEMETWAQRANLSPEVSFLISHPQLAKYRGSFDQVIQLKRVAWVRSEINGEGEILPVEGNRWADTDLEQLQVPVKLEAHPQSGQVVQVIPLKRLAPGLYTLQLKTPTGAMNARVGVNWPAVDRRRYSAANCVDRYLDGDARYRLCSDQRQPIATKWLKVHLVQPEIRQVPGRQPELIVKGVVVNNSDRRRRVPPLEAILVSQRGDVIRRWQFNPVTADVAPGGSTRFESELPNPPAGAANVHVTFTKTARSGGVHEAPPGAYPEAPSAARPAISQDRTESP